MGGENRYSGTEEGENRYRGTGEGRIGIGVRR